MAKHEPPETSGPLDYTGPGFLNGIPARDLEDSDLAALATRYGTTVEALREQLLASGNYQAPSAEPTVVAENETDG